MSENTVFQQNEIEAMVVHAIKDVCSTMLNQDVELIDRQLIESGENFETKLTAHETNLVFGCVGFAGISSGMVYFGMGADTAVDVTMRMLGMSREEVEESYDLVNDVIGELTNMTSGAFKNQLCDKGYNCRLSIPSIIRGKYFVVEGNAADIRESYSFSFGDSVLVFELFMKIDEGSQDDGLI